MFLKGQYDWKLYKWLSVGMGDYKVNENNEELQMPTKIREIFLVLIVNMGPFISFNSGIW